MIEARTNAAPSRPPIQTHHGEDVMAGNSGTRRSTMRAATTSATVPTKNEIAAAITGPPTTVRSWALTANCVVSAAPAAMGKGNSSNQLMPFKAPRLPGSWPGEISRPSRQKLSAVAPDLLPKPELLTPPLRDAGLAIVGPSELPVDRAGRVGVVTEVHRE